MTQVERLARELFTEAYPGRALEAYPRFIFSAWCRLARHVLRRERAAVRRVRGRVRGYVALNGGKYLIADESGSAPVPWKTEAEARYNTTTSNEVARVVAVPRKGGRK